jgi:hypothetical protein
MTDPEQRVAAALRAVHITFFGHRNAKFNDAWYERLASEILTADPTLVCPDPEAHALAAAVRRLDATDIGWSIIHNPGDPLWYVDLADGRTAAESTTLAAITAALEDDRAEG